MEPLALAGKGGYASSMRELFAALPWWSLLAVQGTCLAGTAWWTRTEIGRLNAADPDSIDSITELKAADTASSFPIVAMGMAYMLLPNPWPGTIRSVVLALLSTGIVVLMFVPVRRRAAKVEATDGELVRSLLTEMAVTGGLFASVLLSVVAFSFAAIVAVSRSLLTAQWASLLVVLGVCACYAAALFLLGFFGPRLVVGDGTEGRVAEGVLFDIAAAAFKRAGIPTPAMYLVDGSLEGAHMVGYTGLRIGPVKPILLVEVRLLPLVSVREMAAIFRHEAAHVVRDDVTSELVWKWLLLAVPSACAWLAGVAAARCAPGYEFVAPLPVFMAVVLPLYFYAMRASRRREMDADADAVLLYGAEPQAMIDAVAVVDALNRALEKPSAWAPRTHPHLDERTVELRRRAALSAR